MNPIESRFDCASLRSELVPRYTSTLVEKVVKSPIIHPHIGKVSDLMLEWSAGWKRIRIRGRLLSDSLLEDVRMVQKRTGLVESRFRFGSCWSGDAEKKQNHV